MANYRYEYTDTFGGEANYSWIERGKVSVPETASDSLIMRRVKRALGLSGVRGTRHDYGDTIEFRPYGSATVLFITYCEE